MHELHKKMLEIELKYPEFAWDGYGPEGYTWEWIGEIGFAKPGRLFTKRANRLAKTAPEGFFDVVVDVTPEFSLSK